MTGPAGVATPQRPTSKRELNAFLRGPKIDKGAHSPDGVFCVMEAVAFVAGEEWSDRPRCASPVISDEAA